MSNLYHIRLGTNYTAVFEFFKKVKNTPCYCEVSIHDDYPPMGQGIWKINPELKKLLSKADHFNIQGEESLSGLLWIVYHLAKDNAILAFTNLNHEKQAFIAQGYYKDKLQKLSFNNYQILPKELANDENQQNGVSFCIPTGGDSPQLRKCVERILSFNIPKEIILSGSVSNDFPYKDQVKIVGEDISYPPLRISEKKNVAIEAARYSLACVLHDRVLLPKNFDELFIDLAPVSVMAIGGLVNVRDDWSLVSRYSDFGMALKHQLMPKMQFLSKNEPSYSFTEELWTIFCRTHYLVNGCENHTQMNFPYATGSFFLLSKEVFHHEKLNEKIKWNYFEDVEWGARCSNKFIPSVFNTCYMHLTLSKRAIILDVPEFVSDGVLRCVNYIDENTGKPITREYHHLSIPSTNGISKKNISLSFQSFIDRMIKFFKKNNASNSEVFALEKLLLNNNRTEFVSHFIQLINKICPGNYDSEFVADFENLIGDSLEGVDLEDQKINQRYFGDNFVFSNRLLKNITFQKWTTLFILGILFNEDFTGREKESTVDIYRRMYNSATFQCRYLNDIFYTKKSAYEWFEIFKNLED